MDADSPTQILQPQGLTGRNRQWRWFVAGAMSLCLCGLSLVITYSRARRAERLIAQIKEADGYVSVGSPVWRRLWNAVRAEDVSEYGVTFPPSISPAWIKSRNHLEDLSLACLQFDDAAGIGTELCLLVEQHPLVTIIAPNATDMDHIAQILADKQRLKHVCLRMSDLTDAGLQRLPLEQVETLEVAGTNVTSDGLTELQRLTTFHWICVDGRQICPNVVDILEQSPTDYYMLMLYGRNVTDSTVETVISALAPYPSPKLRTLMLEKSATSPAGHTAWKRARPSIKLSVTSG